MLFFLFLFSYFGLYHDARTAFVHDRKITHRYRLKIEIDEKTLYKIKVTAGGKDVMEEEKKMKTYFQIWINTVQQKNQGEQDKPQEDNSKDLYHSE